MKTEEFLKICNIEVTKLDRKIVIDQSRLIALLDKHKEAINYTHCCTELKDKEVITFSQWIERFDFKPLGNKQYLRGITTIGFDVVREKYLNYIKNL